jgi:biopolymer transport protein TolQ
VSDLELLAIGFRRGTVVPALLGLLIACSAVSWAIIIRTWLVQCYERRGYQRMRVRLDRPAPGIAWLGAVATEAGDDGASRIVGAAVRYGLQQGSTKSLERVRVGIKAAVVDEIERLQRTLPLLASISTVSPYLGLFGTVWGVMDAFGAFGGLEDQAAFAQVAPGIAQALVATGIGLAVAIPAAIAYNLFLARAGRIADSFDLIGEELLARLVDGNAPHQA